ncbi:MAG: sulfatase-like hydrolase/transferase [Thalassotalea sp.]
MTIKSIHMILLGIALCISNTQAKNLSTNSAANLKKPKPNVVLIFSDDQMWNSLGLLENSEVKTPNLDRLAAKGAAFTNAYNMGSYAPAVCVSSRAMLNTGAFLWRAEALTKSRRNHQDRNTPKNLQTINYKLDKSIPDAYWSQYMQQAGYETYFAGKWHVQGVDASQIFDHTLNVRGGMPKAHSTFYSRKFEQGKPDGVPYNKALEGFWRGGKHWSEVLADDSETFFEQAKVSDKPFFMYLAFNAPHDPRQAPKKYIDMYDVNNIKVPTNFLAEYPYNEEAGAGRSLRDERTAPFPRTEHAIKVTRQEYFALITHMDEQIGRVLAALEKSGKADNTYVFFTSDHGLAVGDHGFLGKQNMYDSSMKVPFLITGPGIPASSTVDAPIYLQDVMATSLAIAGVEKPAQVDFHNILPLAQRKTTQGKYDSIYGAYITTQRMFRHGKYKLIMYPRANVIRLYDMENDPLETIDLAEGEKRPVALIKKLFNEFQLQQQLMHDPLNVSDLVDNFLNNIPPTTIAKASSKGKKASKKSNNNNQVH